MTDKPPPSPLLGKMESVDTTRREQHVAAFKAAQAEKRKAQPWPKRRGKKRGR